jgi:alkylation response protein AidB-like acyl-CoA dehydrogenase
MAKLFASEVVRNVAHDCAQIFGGNGYMEEYTIARLHRDSLGFTVGAGTSEILRGIIAREADLTA